MEKFKVPTNQEGLQSLQLPDATAPECRYGSAAVLQNAIHTFIDHDQQAGRSKRRASVQGMFDGNAPYSPEALREANRSNTTNVNFRSGKSTILSIEGILYAMFEEATPCAVITQKFSPLDSEVQRSEYSDVMSEVAHDVLNSDDRWHVVNGISARNMALHGLGPLYFETPMSVIPKDVAAGSIYLPEDAKSSSAWWEQAHMLVDYTPEQVYSFIRNEAAAEALGWNVAYTKWCIMNAVPIQSQVGNARDWEYYQRLFKQGSIATQTGDPMLRLAMCFWKEIDGTITQAIVEESTRGGLADPMDRLNSLRELGITSENDSESGVRFLFFKQGRYKEWSEIVHPMYFDQFTGFHYTATGPGTDLFAAMDLDNRLMCNAADKAMAPTTIFQAETDSQDEFALTTLHEYGEIPKGYEIHQFGVAGRLDEQIGFRRELDGLMTRNFAQYRSSGKTEGNPATGREYTSELQKQFAASNTLVSTYYRQRDSLMTEIVNRLCKKGNDDKLAKKFKEQCLERGVPEECFDSVIKVESGRVVGNGSVALRQIAAEKMVAVASRFPEQGQEAVWCDFIAAHMGPRAAKRYFPVRRRDHTASEQEVDAMLCVSAMKQGMAIPPTDTQDPVIFASAYLGAAGQAIGSLQRGANPAEVFQFVQTIAPVALAHIQRFANDPQRKQIATEMMKQFKKLASVSEQLAKKVQDTQEQQRASQQGPQLPPDVAEKLRIEDAKAKLKMQNMMMSHRQRLQQRAEQHALELQATKARIDSEVATQDLRAAGEIRRSNLKALAEPTAPMV